MPLARIVSTRRASICGASLLALAACVSTPPPAPPQPPEPAPVPSPPAPAAEPPAAEPDKSLMRISIASVGDMMIGTDYPQNHLPDDDGAGFLAAVAPWLTAADVAIGNLEGVLADGGTPGKKCGNPDACYLFRSPTRYAAHYRAAGFDVLSLANNHARDFGEAGRTSTMMALADAGILQSGRIGEFASFEVRGLKLAVLAYAVTRNSNLLLDYAYARRTVSEFANAHDIVIVSFHGGAEGRDVSRLPFGEEEYYGEPRGDVVRFARMAVDAGADLVIGHGPHVVRALERYRDRLIAYSLGNFATYYGISVEGDKGVAPILITNLDGNGRFVDGLIVSTVQVRPAGPSVDPLGRALGLMRELSLADFGEPGIRFLEDGRIVPAERPPVEPGTYEAGSEGDGGPAACSDAWFWLLESMMSPGDGAGHGPDIGSDAWKSLAALEFGLADDPALPAVDSRAWCNYVDFALFSRRPKSP